MRYFIFLLHFSDFINFYLYSCYYFSIVFFGKALNYNNFHGLLLHFTQKLSYSLFFLSYIHLFPIDLTFPFLSRLHKNFRFFLSSFLKSRHFPLFLYTDSYYHCKNCSNRCLLNMFLVSLSPFIQYKAKKYP